MKRAPIICLSLLLMSGPMQKPANAITVVSKLQLYWLKRAKKEILRTEANPLAQALDNSLRFVANDGFKKLIPVLFN